MGRSSFTSSTLITTSAEPVRDERNITVDDEGPELETVLGCIKVCEKVLGV